MVELHALEDQVEVSQIHALLVRHHQYTGSEVAQRVINRWEDHIGRFIKVMPTEYRRVLERQLNMKSDLAKLAAV